MVKVFIVQERSLRHDHVSPFHTLHGPLLGIYYTLELLYSPKDYSYMSLANLLLEHI